MDADSNKEIIHIVWSPASGPLCAYWVFARADEHARSMLGVEVTACELAAGGPLGKIIHIVWSAVTGPMMAFWSSQRAHNHAQDVRGGVKVSECEIRAQLPAALRDDVYVAELDDFDDNDTPVDDIPDEIKKPP